MLFDIKGVDRATLADPRMLALPHPKRLDLINVYKAHTQQPFWPRWQPLLADPTRNMNDVLRALHDDPAMMRIYHINNALADMHRGNLAVNMMHLAWKERGARMFQTRDSLEELLARTDVGTDVPCHYLKMPYPCIYIEFGQHRQSPLRMHHPMSGAHILEGAYLVETHLRVDFATNTAPHYRGILEPGENYRYVEIALTGSPLGKKDIGDDATRYAGLWIRDEDESIETMLERSIRGMNAGPSNAQVGAAERAELQAALAHLIKVLLYLNSSTARTSLFLEETGLRQELARSKGGGKQSKLRRKLSRVYDRILVGPDVTVAANDTDRHVATGREVSAHWRRGHIREQPCGPGRQDRRIVFIEPVLVRADNVAAAAPRNKTYVVR